MEVTNAAPPPAADSPTHSSPASKGDIMTPWQSESSCCQNGNNSFSLPKSQKSLTVTFRRWFGLSPTGPVLFSISGICSKQEKCRSSPDLSFNQNELETELLLVFMLIQYVTSSSGRFWDNGVNSSWGQWLRIIRCMKRCTPKKKQKNLSHS